MYHLVNILQQGKSLLKLLPTLLMLVILTGCGVGANYGTTVRDRDLNNLFYRYEVLPDHMYYTSGGYDKPNAILALHKDYALDNPGTLWVAWPDVGYSQMRKWMSNITTESDFRQYGDYFASYILAPDGKRVGAWYANEQFATVKFLEGNRVFVQTPELNTNYFRSRGSRAFGMP